jgi:ferritin-like metal-binding protein YciE
MAPFPLLLPEEAAMEPHVSLDTMQDLLVHQLWDLYSAEHQILEAWPRLTARSTARSLRLALHAHCDDTTRHLVRLEEALELLDVAPDRVHCGAMERLLREATCNAMHESEPAARDALILGDCQRVEGYEIATYSTARVFAETLGHVEIVALLERTLVEEEVANAILTEIDRREIQPARQRALALTRLQAGLQPMPGPGTMQRLGITV